LIIGEGVVDFCHVEIVLIGNVVGVVVQFLDALVQLQDRYPPARNVGFVREIL